MSVPAPRPDWAFFFDIDGTLAELAARPEQAHVAPALRERIARFREVAGGAVALVSGRSLDDIDRLFGGPLPAAGQHGAERRDAQGRVTHVPAALRERLAGARRTIADALTGHPGLLLEDKGYALALHYRAVPDDGDFVRDLMRTAAGQLGGGFAVQEGKRVVELLPAGVDKGSAIRAFLDEPPFRGRRPVFLGDDVTDEAGFAAVNALGGLSIKVGAGSTSAHFRLDGVHAVGAWMAAMDHGGSEAERTGT